MILSSFVILFHFCSKQLAPFLLYSMFKHVYFCSLSVWRFLRGVDETHCNIVVFSDLFVFKGLQPFHTLEVHHRRILSFDLTIVLQTTIFAYILISQCILIMVSQYKLWFYLRVNPWSPQVFPSPSRSLEHKTFPSQNQRSCKRKSRSLRRRGKDGNEKLLENQKQWFSQVSLLKPIVFWLYCLFSIQISSRLLINTFW